MQNKTIRIELSKNDIARIKSYTPVLNAFSNFSIAAGAAIGAAAAQLGADLDLYKPVSPPTDFDTDLDFCNSGSFELYDISKTISSKRGYYILNEMEDKLETEELKLNRGFVSVGNDTWLPKRLYTSRQQARWREARSPHRRSWPGPKPSAGRVLPKGNR